MTNFFRFRPVLQGFIGAPGINTWHGEESVLGFDDEDPQAFATAVREVYYAIRHLFTPDVRVTFPAEVTWHDEATGDLRDVFPIAALTDVSSTAAGSYSYVPRSDQAVARLHTEVVRNGRRLQGRHFIGPINTMVFDGSGQVASSYQASIAGAYGGLIDSPGPNLVVWGPPIKDDVGNTIHAGKKGVVKSVSVNATPGTLRSRKV